MDYYLRRCTANIEIIEKFYLIGRTSEFAKLYGILFSEVLSRGSQVSWSDLLYPGAVSVITMFECTVSCRVNLAKACTC